jgi:hypothetical protein
MESKVCSKCGEEKPLCEFSKNKNNYDGHHHHCKLCINSAAKEYRKKHSEKLKEVDRLRYEKNKDKINSRNKKYQKINKDKLYEKAKIRKKNNILKVTAYHKKYREDNAEKFSQYKKEYKLKNKHIIVWRRVLYNSLRRFNKKKEGQTIDLLGYSAEDLKNHLESLFTEGMSWDNYGEWHIDHIVGVVNFDPETPQSIVNALSNLRPMWSTTREINGVIYEGNLNRPKYENLD